MLRKAEKTSLKCLYWTFTNIQRFIKRILCVLDVSVIPWHKNKFRHLNWLLIYFFISNINTEKLCGSETWSWFQTAVCSNSSNVSAGMWVWWLGKIRLFSAGLWWDESLGCQSPGGTDGTVSCCRQRSICICIQLLSEAAARLFVQTFDSSCKLHHSHCS